MATILDRYGIKEVADVTFYKINDQGEPTVPVLYLDTLKVSTIEQTAENTSARGGKGNPELISWDYGKEITVTLEDALFSPKSMAMMFGSEVTDNYQTTKNILRTVRRGEVTDTSVGTSHTYSIKVHGEDIDLEGSSIETSNTKFYTLDGKEVTSANYNWASFMSTANSELATAAYAVVGFKANKAFKIDINSDTFPGTYYVTGDTYARSDVTGEDQFFQFIIHKAKVTSEVTLTMEADGDPSTFSMNLKVLKAAGKPMMELVQYTFGAGSVADNTTGLYAAGYPGAVPAGE